jgi:hypothetical protein
VTGGCIIASSASRALHFPVRLHLDALRRLLQSRCFSVTFLVRSVALRGKYEVGRTEERNRSCRVGLRPLPTLVTCWDLAIGLPSMSCPLT